MTNLLNEIINRLSWSNYDLYLYSKRLHSIKVKYINKEKNIIEYTVMYNDNDKVLHRCYHIIGLFSFYKSVIDILNVAYNNEDDNENPLNEYNKELFL